MFFPDFEQRKFLSFPRKIKVKLLSNPDFDEVEVTFSPFLIIAAKKKNTSNKNPD